MAYIVRLRGEIIEKTPAQVIIECAGIGYGVTVPLSTFDRLPAIGTQATLLIHHIVREDDALLFGFLTDCERNFFKTLLTISGVGPKLALSVLSGLSTNELITAIAEGDVRRLSSISGVGKKTAERIIVELKDNVTALENITPSNHKTNLGALPTALHDAILSLVTLGNKQEDARKLVQEIYKQHPDATVQELIRLALRK